MFKKNEMDWTAEANPGVNKQIKKGDQRQSSSPSGHRPN